MIVPPGGGARGAKRSRGLRAAAIVFAFALVSAVGCGKKGAPIPPQPRGPLPPAAVDVRQVGDDLRVTALAPETRGARPGQTLAGAELVRVDFAAGSEPPADSGTFRRRGETVGSVVASGWTPGTRVDLVDAGAAGGETAAAGGGALVGRTVRYGVRVFDRRGRRSALAFGPVIEPRAVPGEPRGLRAEVTAEGVRLRWDPVDGASGYNVYRARVGEALPFEAAHPSPLDATAHVDPGVRVGASYRYVVHAVVDGARPYREGPPSSPIEVEAVDRFAPSPPAGVVAVQEGPAVRLFWDPSPERDVAGYRVYRKARDAGWDRIGDDPVPEAQYRDDAVRVGEHWTYRVTAIDRATPPNESEPSDEVVAVVVDDPAASGKGS